MSTSVLDTDMMIYFRLDIEVLKAKGVEPGPLYARIKSGETITTTGGEIVSLHLVHINYVHPRTHAINHHHNPMLFGNFACNCVV